MLASETDKHWNRGYISGAFDMFHIGHLHLIRRAKERCEHLIVGVLADECIVANKKKWPVIPLDERMEIVGALKYVDEIDITTQPLLNKITAWEKYHFDAMFSGDDHLNDGWTWEEEDLKARGAVLVFFPYTSNVSTTFLQDLVLPPKADDTPVAAPVETFRHVFPFDRINKGERIVIYGAGRVGMQYASQLSALDYCEITAFADSYAKEGDTYAGCRCLTPEELKRNVGVFDRVVVASASYRDDILQRLRSLGIPPERIV